MEKIIKNKMDNKTKKTNKYGKCGIMTMDVKAAITAGICLLIFLSTAAFTSATPVIDGLLNATPDGMTGVIDRGLAEYDEAYYLVYTQDIGAEEHVGTVFSSKDENGD